MKSTQGKKKTGTRTDTDKAIPKPYSDSTKGSRSDEGSEISLDNVVAEKDEVKNAEERLRQKNK